MPYFIEITEIRVDGEVNKDTIRRAKWSSALAEFFAQCKNYPGREDLKMAHVVILDSNLREQKREDITTSYVPPVIEETGSEA